jgi:ACS family tartrate transporter-like MFS transporter
MVLIGRHSDRTGERRWHVAICAAVGAAGLAACALTSNPVVALILLCISAAGIWGTLGPFWALPPAFLGGTAAAAGIALINSLGNLGGGFIGPNVMGPLKDHYQSYKPGLVVSAAVLLAGGCLTLAMRTQSHVTTDVAPLDAPGH